MARRKKIIPALYVERIESNLKSPTGKPYKVDLASKTLLVGSNTSHKSAIIQSLELALTGAVDDVVGRSAVKDAALLMTLAPGNALMAKASMSDSTESIWSATAGKTPDHEGAQPDALVLRKVRETLAASATVARKSCLSWAAGRLSRVDVMANLPIHLHAKYEDIADKQRGSEIDRLLAISEYAAKRQRDCSREVKGAQTVLDAGLGEGVTSRPTDEDVKALRVAVQKHQAELVDAMSTVKASGPVGLDRKEIEAELIAAQEAVTDWSEMFEKTKLMTATLIRHAQACMAIEWARENGVEQCPTCSSPVGSAHLTLCETFHRGEVEKSAQTQEYYEEAQKTLTGWQHDVARLEGVLEALACPEVVEAEDYDQSDIDALQGRLAAATSALTATETALAQWDSLTAARDTVGAMKSDAETYKELKKVCDSAVSGLLDACSDAFSEKVNGYLPSDWMFAIELRDGKKQVFRMGLLRNGRLHCALSGAEWASVTTAIAMAIMEVRAQKELTVLIPEDRAFDTKTLANVMRAFGSFAGQVVMASTVKPKGKLPAGWTVIDMDAWSGMPATDEATEQNGEAVDKPSEDSTLAPSSIRILSGLGYDETQIGRMKSESAAIIIRDGLFADSVSVLRDGTIQVIASNVVPMPPS